MEPGMYQQISPNMLKTFSDCPRKYDFKYLQNISMPVNDEIFEFGKNIHALASYYLKKENIDNMEKALSPKELEVWLSLKSSEYFGYEVVGTEYNLAVKIGKHFFGGRIDAIVRNNGKYFILDYKTGSAPKNAKYDYQTMIYILCVADFFKTKDISFIYIDLKNKQEVTITLNPDLEKEYRTKLTEITAEIDSFESAPKKNNCKCEYSKICF